MNLAQKISWIKTRKFKTFDSLMGIRFSTLSKGKITASLKVRDALKQPFGILHGGVHLAFAESLASIGGWLNAEEGYNIVGVELNGNHLKAIASGTLIGTATPIHIGKRTQVWEIKIKCGKALAHIARCTLMAVPERS